MLHKPSAVFTRLMNSIHQIPVIDCHEHLHGPVRDLANAPTDPILRLITSYLVSDLWTCSKDREISILQSTSATIDEKWEIFSRLWAATEHTAYARVTKIALKQIYGIDKMTRDNLGVMAEQMKNLTPEDCLKIITDSGIKAVVADVLLSPPWEDTVRFYRNPVLREYLEGRFEMPEI
jgi:glucuronate isomerase